MKITILGAESLGVRSLSCVVEAEDRRIVIDPGLALGYRRHGLLPHPVQVAAGEEVGNKIIAALRNATDVVISHFHGDHIPLPDANPYQMKAQRIAPLCHEIRFWAKGVTDLSDKMKRRKIALCKALNRDLPNAEGQKDGPLTFSLPMPHGEPHTHLGTVMMTRVEDEETVFVHASDIQLLDEEAVSLVLDWQPDIALVGGPPLYLSGFMMERLRRKAWEQTLRLAQGVETLILDHHLLRCEEGLDWLDRLSAETGHRVICGADFMKYPRRLLEAQRQQLYEEISVPKGWHAAYARGDADTRLYQDYKLGE